MAGITSSNGDTHEEDEFEEEDEEDENTEKSIHTFKDKYKMYLEEYKEEGEHGMTSIFSATIKNEANVEIGSLTSYLFNRGSGMGRGFWSHCDAETQETCDVALLFTTQGGRLKYNNITGLERETHNMASRGGFLVVYEVQIEKEERGKDLSLDMVDKFLDLLGERWTIAWMSPYTLNSEETENQSEDEREAGNIAVARHFSRMGFVQASIQDNLCRFWYLIPSRRTRKEKEEVRNLPVVLEPSSKYSSANENPNFLVKSVLAENTTPEMITELVEGGVDINKSEALFYAISNNKVAIVQHLLKLGADVCFKNKFGLTPLHHAAMFLNPEICLALLEFCSNKEGTDDQGESPFEKAIECINNMTQYEGTFDLHLIRVMKFEERCGKLVSLHLLMKDPSKLIGGILTPRMFFRLQVTAEISADTCEGLMPNFENRVPLDYEDADIFLLNEVPKNEVPKKIYKSYALGWQKQMKAIGDVMRRGLLPTECNVQRELEYFDGRYNSFYKKNGGKLLHGLVAIVETARDQSEAEGDGFFEEVYGEDLEKLPAMEFLDDDFLFVKHFFLSYCVTPGAKIIIPEVKGLPPAPASQQPEPGSPKAGPSGVKKRSAESLPPAKRNAQKSVHK